jgi:rhamnulose-1-phosphate aldolase
MIGNLDSLLNFSGDLNQKKEMKPILAQVASTAQHLWEKGWAERNAGNFSVNVTGTISERETERLTSFPFYPLPKSYPDLAGQLLLVSGSGTRMRDVAADPVITSCFIYINSAGSAFHIIEEEPGKNNLRPTSELATHLAVHQQLVQKKSPEKVLLHAHVTELIALTQHPAFLSEEAINAMMWGMHPETMLFLPGGLGFIPFRIPGSEIIAMDSLQGFDKHKVVLWEKHGCMAIGDTIADAFDLLDLAAKSARIFFICKSAGFEPQGLTDGQLRDIREHLQS